MSGVPTRQAPMRIGAAVPSLVRWKLSSDADLVYRTLATMGCRESRELASELGLPVRRVDGALAELRTAGAATEGPSGRPCRPIGLARPPAEVVAALQRARRHHDARPPAGSPPPWP